MREQELDGREINVVKASSKENSNSSKDIHESGGADFVISPDEGVSAMSSKSFTAQLVSMFHRSRRWCAETSSWISAQQSAPAE